MYSALSSHWKSLRILCYSPDDGLRYGTWGVNGGLNEFSNLWDDMFDFQIVCDGLIPVYGSHFFNVPCTQESFDEIRPAGFGLYAARIGNTWSLASPEASLVSYLPATYDAVSHIGVWHYLGGDEGFRDGDDFLGVVAPKGDATFYYSFEKNRFVLKDLLSSDEIRECKM